MANPDNSFVSISPKESQQFSSRKFSKVNVLTAGAFAAGIGVAAYLGVESVTDRSQLAQFEKVDSGIVTKMTLEWERSTESTNTHNIMGIIPLYTTRETIIDDPDFILTIENCDKGPTMCVSADLYVSEDIYEATKVGDVVDFSENDSVSAEDPNLAILSF